MKSRECRSRPVSVFVSDSDQTGAGTTSTTATTNTNDVLHRNSPLLLACALTSINDLPLPQKELTHTIMLHPSYFGPRMQQYLESKLYSDVEGTCSGQFGFIIAVVSISDIGKGMVISGNGQAEFVTRYRAIVFKPFKGEVVDGVVHNVTRVNIYRSYQFFFTRVSLSRLAQMGIFAEVGPLNCFVSQQVRDAFRLSSCSLGFPLIPAILAAPPS
jgi:DNA-directed RNA polymerase subunit E'/Rpb7